MIARQIPGKNDFVHLSLLLTPQINPVTANYPLSFSDS